MKLPTTETIAGELETPNFTGEVLLNHIDGIRRRYDEPWRRHHVFEHPLSLFADFIAHKQELKDSGAVAWTILYHDSIYDPEAPPGRNEELSAQLVELETPVFLPVRGVRKIAHYTRATANHSVAEQDQDLEFFLDADLAILGASPKRYDAYARDIREEYRHVKPELYIPGRIGILRSLAKRHQSREVYGTEIFRAKYEEQAQANIAREIDFLAGYSPK